MRNFKKFIFSYIIIFSLFFNPVFTAESRASGFYRLDSFFGDRICAVENSTHKTNLCLLQKNLVINILFKIEKEFSRVSFLEASVLVYNVIIAASAVVLILSAIFFFYKVLVNHKFRRVTLLYQTVR